MTLLSFYLRPRYYTNPPGLVLWLALSWHSGSPVIIPFFSGRTSRAVTISWLIAPLGVFSYRLGCTLVLIVGITAAVQAEQALHPLATEGRLKLVR